MSSTHIVRQYEEKNLFLHRVSEIPLVKALYETVAFTYENAKHSSPLIGATLEKAEFCAKLANEQSEPLKKFLDGPLTTVSKIADKQLEDLQRRFPVINTTPEELKQYGQNIKHRLDDTKVADATGKVVSTVQGGQHAISRLIIGTLNITEDLVDKYIASPDAKKRSCGSTDQGSYITRVSCISSKMVDGSIYRTTITYDSVKNFTMDTYNYADKTIKDTTASISSTIQKTINDVSQIRASITKEISTRSRAVSAKSEAAAVYLTKAVSNGIANISDSVINTATPYLPEGMEKPASALVSYAHHWQERMQNANTAGEIWKAAVDETKRNLRLARELVQSILNNNHEMQCKEKHW